MPTLEEKIRATEFTLPTSLTFHDAIAAADKAAAGSGNLGTSMKRSQLFQGVGAHYQVVRLGAMPVGAIHVRYFQGAESPEVAVTVPDYLISQAKFLFIPLGPEESPVLSVARAFSDRLKAALTA